MALHKFRVGQTVHLSASHFGQRAGGLCTILQQLPEERGELHYRIRLTGEPHERVVPETELSQTS